MKRRTTIILFILAIVVAVALIVYQKVQEKRADAVRQKPDVATTVTDLLAAFEKDTANAAKTYVDKIVELKGLVKSVDTTGAVIMGEEGNPSEVVVGFDNRHTDDLKKIRAGTIIMLQGVCSGYEMSSADPDDLLSGLGTTIHLRSAGLKENSND